MGYLKRRWIEEMEPKEEPPMGHMKDLLITVYGGGDEAVEAAKKLQTLGEWISVSERLPKTHEVVLYFANEPHRCVGVQIGHLYDGTWQGRWKEPTGAGETKIDPPCVHERFVTHWMPLPEPPEAKP